MCQRCEAVVERSTAALDYLIECQRKVREQQPGTPAEHIISLACTMMEQVEEHPDMATAVRDLAVGLAIAVERLIGLQHIHGIPVI